MDVTLTIYLHVVARPVGQASRWHPRDQSLNPLSGEFLVAGMKKKPSLVPRSQSTGKMDRPSHRVTGPCVQAGHGVRKFSRAG
jgi:hypothetical protein